MSQLNKHAVITGVYKDFTSKSMIDFVFMLRNRTTSELVRDFPKNFNQPIWKGSQSEMVKDMLAIDAIQFILIGEYAKFCRTELHKKLFDETDENNCLFTGWKLSKNSNSVYNDDFSINIDTLECLQYVEGGCLDFQIIGHTIGQVFDVIKEIDFTDNAIKRIFGIHQL